MVLDYSKTCAYCSEPMTAPPRDGAGSTCAYLHTRAGRRDFERIAQANRDKQQVIDAVTSVSSEVTLIVPEVEVVTESGDLPPSGDQEVVTLDNAVTVDEEVVTEFDGLIIDPMPAETKQQRYRRLNRERINQAERDRRNST